MQAFNTKKNHAMMLFSWGSAPSLVVCSGWLSYLSLAWYMEVSRDKLFW